MFDLENITTGSKIRCINDETDIVQNVSAGCVYMVIPVFTIDADGEETAELCIIDDKGELNTAGFDDEDADLSLVWEHADQDDELGFPDMTPKQEAVFAVTMTLLEKGTCPSMVVEESLRIIEKIMKVK